MPSTEFEASHVRAVVSGRSQPIRLYNGERFAVDAAAVVSSIAVDFCGADVELSKSAIIECVRILKERFGNLGLNEVKEAFTIASTGKTDANLSAYGGAFTVRIFGDVMAAYMKHRAPIVAALMAEETDKGVEAEIQVKNEKARAEVVAAFDAGAPGFNKPQDIPDHWAKILINAGRVESSADTWLKAKQLVRNSFMDNQRLRLPDPTIPEGQAKEAYRQMCEDSGLFHSCLVSRAESLYGKMIVWNAIQKNNLT